MKNNLSDAGVVGIAFAASYLLAALLDFNQLWVGTFSQSMIGLEELPVALSFFAVALGWFAWRRREEIKNTNRQLSETIELLELEVEERRLAEEHAHVLSATRNEILESEMLRSEKLEQIRQMGDYLASASSPQELKEIAVKCLQNLLPDHTAGVLFTDNSFQSWQLAGAWGAGKNNLHTQVNQDACWVLRRGQAYTDASNQQTMLCNHANVAGVQSVACYPIFYRDMQFGVLHIRSAHLQSPLLPDEEEKILIGVCHTLGLHFYNAHLRAELSLASHRDELTGLLNRRGLTGALKREIKASGQQGYEVTVAMVDVDHFKQYNDSFGHQEGDNALKFVAENLTSQMRSRDVVARYGGEEFMLIMPNTSKVQAYKKLKQVIKKAEQESANSALCKRAITLSVGLATAPQDHVRDDILVKYADLALYAAKKRGRNCVIAYNATQPDKLISTRQL